MLYAIFKTSTLPVRSPFPNKVPSTRSAPASRESSALATPVPRSLCGCTERIMLSRSSKCLFIHSIWSAYTFGVFISTVDGRLIMIGFSLVAPHVFCTSVQIRSANGSSVPVKLSGEYSKMILPGKFFAHSFTILVPSTAMLTISSSFIWNTTSLCSVEVEL